MAFAFRLDPFEMALPHLSVCICTCGRPALLERLLRDVARQDAAGQFTFSVVVTDNDAAQSARETAERCARETGLQILYTVEAERNIAIARNTVVSHARGDLIAFIDDDEFPVDGWLLNLFRTLDSTKAAGVLAPVEPHFEKGAPEWVIKGRFYNRPRHTTGFELNWQECRTGNVLFRRSILDPNEPPFKREFRNGGEDQDFFRRMIERGHRFVWCDEAVAYEVVPPSRWNRKVMLSRALLRGKNSLRHKRGRLQNLVKSGIAVPAYALALPILFVAGHHYFMRYLIKLADHTGRLLAVVGLNPISERRT
jgi:glycosyltransferase involved in cell wall biosynthesis